MVQMQAQLLHAVSGEAERQEGAMELGHGARFTADKTARRTRTAGTGFNFQRVPGPTKRTSDSRPFVVYQHGRYTPIGGEGGLVRGWTFHDDSTDGPDWWRPDRERATADDAMKIYKAILKGRVAFPKRIRQAPRDFVTRQPQSPAYRSDMGAGWIA